MSIVVGTLSIDLVANTASFSQSMDKMSQLSAKTANDIKRSLEKITAIGLAMGAAIATGTAALIEGSIDAADKLGKLAQATGTTAETLSVLSYAGKLAGVETEQLGKGLEKLSQAAFKAQNGNQGLQNIFGRLGVSATDSNGRLKDSGVLMEELAVKFSGTADGAGKTALAMALFGKAGAALIPFLNQYGAEQARVNEEAHQFGLVLSTSTVEIAAKAHDNLMRLQEVLRGVGFAVLGATLPAMVDLSDKLVQIAKDADIPDLAKAFGEKVVTAVTVLGNALEFAEKHAHALKIALEGLAALGALKIAIPVIGDLVAGGVDKLGAGVSRAAIALLGLGRVLPTLAKFGTWASETAQFVALLATEEGLASAATYVLGGAFVAVGGWVGLAVGAVVGLGVALYKLRDSTFELAGSTYELRDAWKATGTVLGDVWTSLEADVSLHVGNIKKLWGAFTGWFSANPIVAELNKISGGFFNLDEKLQGTLRGIIGKLTPQPIIDALNKAKKDRLDAALDSEIFHPVAPLIGERPKKVIDTSGLGKAQKDPYAEEIRKLDEATAAQKAYLAVLDGTPEQIAQVAAAEKAQGIILELNNRLRGEGKPLLTALQQATISQKVATEESTKALVEYGRELVAQQHGADLAIQQTRAMAAANLEGDAAIRRTVIDNAILGLTFNRTAEQIKTMTPELAKLREELTAKSSIEIVASASKEIDGLRDQLAERQLVTAATLDSIDAQRQAALASKTFKLDQNIAEAPDDATRQALLRQKDALVELTKAEWAANDAESARSLLSPEDEYQRSADSLNHAVEALKELQGGTLTYTQQLGIAAKQQDEFNKATDGTIELLLKEGSLGDGVTAFFLKMQESAKTAAETIFDTMNEMFNKLSDNLTQLITAPNRWKRKDAINAFAGTFEGIGKNLLDSQIKTQLQGGLGALGKVFGIDLSSATGKVDGSTSSNALWVRWASANGSPVKGLGGGSASAAASAGGNELDDLLGGPPSPQPTFPSVRSGASQAASVLGSVTQGQPGPVGIAGGILSTFGKLFGLKQPAGRSGVLGGETLGLPTSFAGSGASDSGNELDNLIGPAPALQSIPTLLRRTHESETGLTAGEDTGASSVPVAPDVQPKPYTLITRPQPSALSGILQSVLGAGSKLFGGGGGGNTSGAASGASDAAGSTTDSGISDMTGDVSPTVRSIPTLLRRNFQADTGLSAGEGTQASQVPIAPDVQPKKYTLITMPHPSALSGILSTVLGLGTKMLGGSGGGGSAGADAAGSAASSVTDAAASSESDISDFSDFMMAGGGHVSGPGTGTSDSIRARLSHGEFVTKAAQTAKYLPLLHRINNDTLPRFAIGGIVGYDDGGFVSPDAAYAPASSNYSTMSDASSRISKSSASSRTSIAGDTHQWNIHIPPGANDPAQMTAHLDRYMRTAAPQIAAMALHAVKDQQLRRAPSAR